MEARTVPCPACRAPAAQDARFCWRCGAALAPADTSEARRTVTAMFADVVGSTPLAERLDPEDFRAVVGDAVSLMVTAVEAYDGTVEHVAGDGLLALFGAPHAHEDDAERAVLAGLRLVADVQERAAELAERWSIDPPSVRVGIETGLVIIGPLARVELTAMGDSINTAARIQAAAAPGTVLVGERTSRLVEHAFDWGERRELQLKGKAETVAAVEALRPREWREKRADAPLIGRERELAAGLAALDEAAAGRGGVLLVSGDAGIGKSRLVYELHERWSESAAVGSLWLAARCVSYGRALPYLPFRQLLDHPDLLSEARELAPALAPVLGAAAGPHGVAGPDAPDLRRRSFDAVRTLLERRAAGGALVLTLDDAHWADPSSAALTEHLLPSLLRAPVLLVIAARAEDEGPARALHEAVRRVLPGRVRELRLQPLGEEMDRRLLEQLLGTGTLPTELERRVLERAEGNPFYLEELVRSLTEAGALVEQHGRLRWVGDARVAMPDTVERLVLARIDRLAPWPREVARAASVLGRQFGADLLEAVTGADVPSALLELERHDVVSRAGADQYRFKHTLIQEAIYASQLKRRRQVLHGRAALALEGLEPSRHGLLAHHWSAAGNDDRALTEHERAARSALDVYAVDEAREHAANGIAAGERLGVGPEDPRIRGLLRMRGWASVFGQDLTGAGADLELALDSARAAGDRRGELSALVDLGTVRHGGIDRVAQRMEEALRLAADLGDAEVTVGVLSRLAILDSSRLCLDLAVARAERAWTIADQARDERLLGLALDARKLAALMLGDLATLESTAGASAEIHRRRGDPFFLSWALGEWAFAPLGRGSFDEARARLDEAIHMSVEMGQHSGRAIFLSTLCWLERSRGRYEAALEAGREAHEVARRFAPPDFVGWVAATLGWALLEARKPDRAADVLANGLAHAKDGEAPAQVLRCSGLLAAAEAERGDLARSAAAADQADAVLESATVPPGGAFLFGAHAVLAVAAVRLEQGDVAAAQRLAAPLLEAAAGSGWVETEACAALVLARCRRRRGDGEDAERLQEQALEVAARVGLPGVERAAAAR